MASQVEAAHAVSRRSAPRPRRLAGMVLPSQCGGSRCGEDLAWRRRIGRVRGVPASAPIHIGSVAPAPGIERRPVRRPPRMAPRSLSSGEGAWRLLREATTLGPRHCPGSCGSRPCAGLAAEAAGANLRQVRPRTAPISRPRSAAVLRGPNRPCASGERAALAAFFGTRRKSPPEGQLALTSRGGGDTKPLIFQRFFGSVPILTAPLPRTRRPDG